METVDTKRIIFDVDERAQIDELDQKMYEYYCGEISKCSNCGCWHNGFCSMETFLKDLGKISNYEREE